MALAQNQGGAFLKRHLEQRLENLLEQRFRNLRFESGEIIPTTSDLQPGAASVIQEQITQVGDAAILGSEAFDFPLADARIEENEFKVIAIASGFSYGHRELMSMEMASRNGSRMRLNDKRDMAARRAIAEKMNKLMAYGSSKYDFEGFLNNSLVTVDDNSLDIYDAATKDEAVYNFFVDEVGTIIKNTNLVDQPTDVLVSIDCFIRINKIRTASVSDTRLLPQIEDALRPMGVQRITPLVELASAQLEANGVHAAGRNKDRIVIYPRDPEIVERHVEPLDFLPEEYRAGRYIMGLYQCTTPPIINFPDTFSYIDHPKP